MYLVRLDVFWYLLFRYKSYKASCRVYKTYNGIVPRNTAARRIWPWKACLWNQNILEAVVRGSQRRKERKVRRETFDNNDNERDNINEMKIYKYMNSKDEDNSGINEAKRNNYRRDNSTIFFFL